MLHWLLHRFYGMEFWVNQDRAVIERAADWQVGEKDATDDGMGRLSGDLGEDGEAGSECQLQTESGGDMQGFKDSSGK